MSRITRPRNEDTALFDGVDAAAKAHIAIRIAAEFIATALYLYILRPLYYFFAWWIHRLDFLSQDDAKLLSYGIDDPNAARREAKFAGTCLAIGLIGLLFIYAQGFSVWPVVLLVVCLFFYGSTTTAYYFGRLNNMVAYSLDAPNEED